MITDEAHYFEVDWAAATFIGENDGFFTFYIDGDLKYTISGIDNDTHQAEHVLLGPWYGIDPGSSGTIFFDAFESHREDYIGP